MLRKVPIWPFDQSDLAARVAGALAWSALRMISRRCPAPPIAGGSLVRDEGRGLPRRASPVGGRPSRAVSAVRHEAVEQLLEDGGAFLAGGCRVLGAGDVQGTLDEG